MSTPRQPAPGVDPRAPRFGAAITSVLLLAVLVLGLQEGTAEPAFVLMAVVTALFAVGAFLGVRRHPWGVLFRLLVRPRLAAPTELESATPPTFAQGVGFVIVGAGLALGLLGVPYGLVAAAAVAFVAAFLNAAFGFCLGCQLYLLLSRLPVPLPRRSA